MGNLIKSFYERQKKILLSMAITVVLFIINIFLMFLVIVTRPEAINNFIQKPEITNEILPFTILSFIGASLGVIFLLILMIFIIKLIIPDVNSVSNLMMKDQAKFLIDLPSNIKKEVFKNGK